MSSKHFDVIWLGTGQATMTVVPQLVAMGKRVAVVEGAKFGGTCVNSGCTPTKTLVASAYAVHTANRGDQFGFSVDNLNVDFSAVMAPQRENRSQTSRSIEKSLNDITGGAVYNGYGTFLNEREVLIDGTTISADTFVIHTGTHPNVPDLPGIHEVAWLTNETILDLDELPKHLVVVGGSYIALEFGQLFRRLGSEVTILERGSRLVAREDDDISELVAARLTDEGIDVRCDCELTSIASANVDSSSADLADGIQVAFDQNGETASVTGSHILFAVGRSPNSQRLNLTAAGVEFDQRGYIGVNEVLQTSVPHIYAVGDINGQGAFTHTSVNDGEIFLDHYRRSQGISTQTEEWDRSLATRTIIYSMFIDPPLARVGMSENEARDSDRNVLMATMPMSSIARAREKRETHGLVKILVDADTDELLGATIFGSSGDEVIGAFATLIQSKASYKVFRRVVFPHPTIAELMPWVLDRLAPLPR